MAAAAPLEGETMVTKEVIPIVRSTQDFETDGSYKFRYICRTHQSNMFII